MLAIEGQGAGGGLVAAPYAMPAFFIGWMAVGIAMGTVLACRGHDTRTMVALGVGLGPLMAVVVADAIHHREPTAAALVMQPGVDHGGPIDVLVLLQGDAEDIRSLLPTISSVRPKLGMLTLARAVDYESIEGDLDNEVVTGGHGVLASAAALVPVFGAQQALWPGPVEVVAERFRRRHRYGLVLLAIAEPNTDANETG